MKRPKTRDLKKLFELLAGEASQLRPVCRWLAVAADLGAERTVVLLAGHARPGTVAELADLSRLLQREAPDLVRTGRWLVGHSEHLEDVHVELQLDLLVAADVDNWEHPTQVLERPRPDFEKLLAACAVRRKSAGGAEGDHLARVEAKVERAVRIAESARQRRERMRRGRKR
ncbi:MAG: hypothetical protein V3T72_21400 [Thermoanaerobaculia bacterium]